MFWLLRTSLSDLIKSLQISIMFLLNYLFSKEKIEGPLSIILLETKRGTKNLYCFHHLMTIGLKKN
jgi:hypothetical protein